MKISTIKLSDDTKYRLGKLKEYKKESYEEIVIKLLEILNTCKVNPDKSQEILMEIDRKNKKIMKNERN